VEIKIYFQALLPVHIICIFVMFYIWSSIYFFVSNTHTVILVLRTALPFLISCNFKMYLSVGLTCMELFLNSTFKEHTVRMTMLIIQLHYFQQTRTQKEPKYDNVVTSRHLSIKPFCNALDTAFALTFIVNGTYFDKADLLKRKYKMFVFLIIKMLPKHFYVFFHQVFTYVWFCMKVLDM